MIFWIVLFDLLAGGRKIEEDIIKVIMIKMLRGEVRSRALRRFYKGEKIFKIGTHFLARLGWFCPVVSEFVKPYFIRLCGICFFL